MHLATSLGRPWREPMRAAGCDAVRVAFGLAALLALLLNFAVAALAPLFFCEPSARRLAAEGLGGLGRGRVAEGWSCLQHVSSEALRLLPDEALEREARQRRRWLFFGLSSVHRKQAVPGSGAGEVDLEAI